jgi:hypothetical protein
MAVFRTNSFSAQDSVPKDSLDKHIILESQKPFLDGSTLTPDGSVKSPRAASLEMVTGSRSSSKRGEPDEANRSVGSLLYTLSPTPRLRKHLSFRNLKNASLNARSPFSEPGMDYNRSTSSTTIVDVTDDSAFLGCGMTNNHSSRADDQPLHPKMELETDRPKRSSTTADLAHFLKTTGPPMPTIKMIPEELEREEPGVVKRMIELGVATFRKRKEPPILETYEK